MIAQAKSTFYLHHLRTERNCGCCADAELPGKASLADRRARYDAIKARQQAQIAALDKANARRSPEEDEMYLEAKQRSMVRACLYLNAVPLRIEAAVSRPDQHTLDSPQIDTTASCLNAQKAHKSCHIAHKPSTLRNRFQWLLEIFARLILQG
jgi:hypothetical protein